MNKPVTLVNSMQKNIFHHNSSMVQSHKKHVTFQSKKKNFIIKTEIKEESNRIVIDSHVEWYDIKEDMFKKKRILQIYDCDDKECEDLDW